MCGKHGCCNERGSTVFYLVFLLEECPHMCGKCVQQTYEIYKKLQITLSFASKTKGVFRKLGFCQQKSGVTCHLLFCFLQKCHHVVRKVASKQKYKCLMIEKWCFENNVFNMEKNPRACVENKVLVIENLAIWRDFFDKIGNC